MNENDVAPSEEFSLLCDIRECEAGLSMVAGVPRSEHGWGRISVYVDAAEVRDYDLCAEHYNNLKKLLGDQL